MYEYHAKLVSLHDGDTGRFDVSLGWGAWLANQPLRFAGIDAPELGTTEGRAARDFVRALLPVGIDVWIRTHRDQDDKFGRLLATIYLAPEDLDDPGAVSVNQLIINAGHAHAYDGGARG